MKTEYLITIFSAYFLINGMITGGFYESDKYTNTNTTRDKVFFFTAIFLLCFFALPVVVATFTYEGLKMFITYMDRLTRISFYFGFYFTKGWDVVTDEIWQNLDGKYFYFKDKKSLSNRHFIHIMKMVHKRHNHIPKTKEQYSKEDVEKRLLEFNQSQIKRYPANIPFPSDFNDFKKHSCGAILPPSPTTDESCHWCGEDFE